MMLCKCCADAPARFRSDYCAGCRRKIDAGIIEVNPCRRPYDPADHRGKRERLRKVIRAAVEAGEIQP